MTGAGFFGVLIGPSFVITVYLAHILFGAALGALTHRFGHRPNPIWIPVIGLLTRLFRRQPLDTTGTGRRPI